MRANAAEELVTISEAARRFAVSRDTIERLIRAGELVAVKVKSRRRVTASSMQEFVARQTE
jgi:excisionase family DNA binding protein